MAYWDTFLEMLLPAVPLVSNASCFKVEPIPLYFHPAPRKPFVRLSEEEITRIGNKTGINWNLPRAIEDALEEKNRGEQCSA